MRVCGIYRILRRSWPLPKMQLRPAYNSYWTDKRRPIRLMICSRILGSSSKRSSLRVLMPERGHHARALGSAEIRENSRKGYGVPVASGYDRARRSAIFAKDSSIAASNISRVNAGSRVMLACVSRSTVAMRASLRGSRRSSSVELRRSCERGGSRGWVAHRDSNSGSF